MKPFVLDASVSASWCLKDESNDRADTLLGMLLETEAIVPPIWPVEMANVLIMAERKGRMTDSDAIRTTELLLSLPIVVEETDIAVMSGIRTLAREHQLTAYDSSYLEAAQRLNLPLETLDTKLRKAAGLSGVKLLPE